MNAKLRHSGLVLSITMVALLSVVTAATAAERKPNFVLILCDDLGYGDISPNGGVIPTPALDLMARQGLLATNYYSPANLCTPSRAGILTGRYPVRMGLGFGVINAGDDPRG